MSQQTPHTSSQPAYTPGDVANGHVLGQDGNWHQLDVTGAEPKKSWVARHKILTGIAGMVAVAVVGSAIGAGGETGSADAATTGSTPSSAPAVPSTGPSAAVEAPVPAPVVPGADAKPADDKPAGDKTTAIGVPARDGKFEFTVTSVEAPVTTIGESFTAQTAQGAYVVVRVDVKNIGDRAQTLFAANQHAFAGKRQFATSSDALFAIDGASDAFLTQINPGNSLTNVPLVFDVPAGTTLTSLELHDGFLSGGATVRLS